LQRAVCDEAARRAIVIAIQASGQKFHRGSRDEFNRVRNAAKAARCKSGTLQKRAAGKSSCDTTLISCGTRAPRRSN